MIKGLLLRLCLFDKLLKHCEEYFLEDRQPRSSVECVEVSRATITVSSLMTGQLFTSYCKE